MKMVLAIMIPIRENLRAVSVIQYFPGGFIDPQLAYENDKSTTPMSDGTYPLVQAFQVMPQSLTTGESFTIDYTVSDTGGSGLNRIELWRKDEQSD
jgi:hypothetical protein